jgi:hypothetical protein
MFRGLFREFYGINGNKSHNYQFVRTAGQTDGQTDGQRHTIIRPV